MINLIASTNTSEPTSVITVLDWPEQPDQIPDTQSNVEEKFSGTAGGVMRGQIAKPGTRLWTYVYWKIRRDD